MNKYLSVMLYESKMVHEAFAIKHLFMIHVKSKGVNHDWKVSILSKTLVVSHEVISEMKILTFIFIPLTGKTLTGGISWGMNL